MIYLSIPTNNVPFMISSNLDYYFNFVHIDQDDCNSIYGVEDLDEIGSIGYGFRQNHADTYGRLFIGNSNINDLDHRLVDSINERMSHTRSMIHPNASNVLPILNYDSDMWILFCKELYWDYRINSFSLWYTAGKYIKEFSDQQKISITCLTRDILMNLPPFQRLTIV